jgi:hypothetical protein
MFLRSQHEIFMLFTHPAFFVSRFKAQVSKSKLFDK